MRPAMSRLRRFLSPGAAANRLVSTRFAGFLAATGLVLTGVAASLLVLGCSDRLAGGSGTGTGNSITATLAYGDGKPAAGVAVRIRRSDYLKPVPGAPPPDSTPFTADGTTNARGEFRKDSLPAGSYVLEAKDSATGALIRFTLEAKGRTAARDTLRPLGMVTGQVRLAGEQAGPVHVQVMGLDRIVQAESEAGRFTFRDLPAGTYAFRAAFAGVSSAPGLENVVVEAGETTAAPILEVKGPFPAWKKSARLLLNTTSSGVPIASDLADFPLLVRLDRSFFDFAGAAGDGRDLRFADTAGKVLPYEIERWDSAGGRAEIWVGLDTVRGNRDGQELRMHWGNADAPPKSSGPAVFDTSAGFRGVWHLGEDRAGTGTADFYRDATGAGRHGEDGTGASGKEGAIGAGQAFDGVDDQIRIPHNVTSFGQPFTLSLWIKISGPAGTLAGRYSGDTLWSQGEMAFYLGDGTWIAPGEGGGQCHSQPVAPGRCVNGRTPSLVGFSRSYAVADAPVGVGAWHHLAYAWDGPAATRIYLDGALLGMGINDMIGGDDSLSYAFYLGRPNGLESVAFFQGSMDEARLCARARSADWIRLAFASQRADASWIRFITP